MTADNSWPALQPLETWLDSAETLHMWLQIVGKIRLKLAPALNHCWGCALYVTSRGLTTSPIPLKRDTFSIDFDFIDHTLRITTSNGSGHHFALQPMTVAAFYQQIMRALHALDIHVKIFTRPVEVATAIPFENDITHASYDAEAIHNLWQAFVQADRVFKTFRARFTGKASPVHFFWGAMDLAATRFSGNDAPPHPGGIPNTPDHVMTEAYSKELSSAGFWPGMGLGEPAFYAYAYPNSPGFSQYPVRPRAAFWHSELGEFILPYAAVQNAPNPDETLLSFLQSTFDAAVASTGRDHSESPHAAG